MARFGSKPRARPGSGWDEFALRSVVARLLCRVEGCIGDVAKEVADSEKHNKMRLHFLLVEKYLTTSFGDAIMVLSQKPRQA